MKKIWILSVLFIILPFLYSCSTSAGEEASVVYLNLASDDGRITEKMVSVTNPSLEGVVFQYKATPLWTSEFGSVQGTQATWTTFTQNTSLGSFAQGPWEFSVRIQSANGVTLYQGATESYVNTGANSVSVSVFRQQVEGEEGTLYIEVTSPTVSDNDKLIIEYGSINNMNSGTTIVVTQKTSTGTAEDRRSTFAYTIDPIDSGTYWVKLAYNNGVTDVGGAIAFVDVIGQEESTLTGTIEAGEWQTCTIVSTGIKSFGIIIRAANNASSVVSGQDLVFTCTKASNEFEDIISYQWYVDGEIQSATGSTFTFNREYDPYASNSNFYRINCIAGDSSSPQICADAIWYIVVKEN